MLKFLDGFAAALMSIITIVLIPLNLLGGIVSGIWLCILGDWGAVGWGLLLMIGGPFILSFPLMLGIGFALPGVNLMEKGKTLLASPFLFLSVSVTYVVIVLWGMLTFEFILGYESYNNLFPLLVWSYGVATAPWAYMASKETQNEYSGLAAFFTQAGFIGVILAYGLFDASIENCAYILIGVLLVGLIIQGLMVIEQTKRQRRYGI